ncbi:MAG: tRNA uridine-5-carboxymethylaminomethyl(34) synthesis GTPase MnmE [Rhodospirillaceae bacterium]
MPTFSKTSERSTIFAPATASGRAGVAVIRISGPAAAQVLSSMGDAQLSPRKMTRTTLHEPHTNEPLDDALVVWFPGPHSFTGEDMVELHCHGGRAVLDGLLMALSGIDGLRPAEPGEFTRRAFDAGKLDLTQVEALADLIDAETRAQTRQALKQMGGALKTKTDNWRDRLTKALAHLEAVIDFPDEDLPEKTAMSLWQSVGDLEREIAIEIKDYGCGERLRTGVHVAIVGPPNAGKSSLLNVLANREAAIVSATPGTTRDVIEVNLDLGGYPVLVSDTAGLRAAESDIEAEGVRRTLKCAEEADIVIALFDSTTYPESDSDTQSAIDERAIIVVNKADLLEQLWEEKDIDKAHPAARLISVKTGSGVDWLIAGLTQQVKALCESGMEAPMTRPRHRRALEECSAALARAQVAELSELAAEDLRLALRALSRITGAVDVEDLLEIVFKDFCIGK